MKSHPTEYTNFNNAVSKALRLVVKINFATPVYLASHDDIPNIPAGTLEDSLEAVSSVSQQLRPDEGRSTIGTLTFNVVDTAGAFTTVLRTKLAGDEGINEKIVELYRGGAGMDWSDFEVEQTQQVDKSIQLENGNYRVQCSDVQRAMRVDVFDNVKTALAADFDIGETTLTVFDTSSFEACGHVASFGDQQTGSYYYLKIKYNNGFEIIRATGKTATTFTGVTRGMFGTDEVNHVFPTSTDSDSSVEVEEYIYLELPFPQLARAVLTGTYEGGTIPSGWNLGIDSAYVDTDSFDNIGEDWFDSSDYAAGLIFRFQGLEKTDGKRFIEKELCLLAGAFLVVGADGRLRLRRMTGVIGTADHVLELNEDNVVSAGAVTYSLDRIVNIFDIRWSWLQFPGRDNAATFYRRNVLVDSTSIAIHGQQKPLELSFRGLHNERHTYTTLRNRFDAVRDRYAGPPIEIPVDLMPSLNVLEVGDIVRLNLGHIRDYTGDGTIDRAFEIQRIVVDQETGRVQAQLFGSTQRADPIADGGAGSTAELPDAWYSSEGTEMAAAGLTIDGAGIMTASGSLSGGTTTRTVFYYLGDFTVAAGVTLTLTGNVELRIRGHFQCNGTIDCNGGRGSNTAGFIGTSYGGPGRLIQPGSGAIVPNGATLVEGQHAAMPVLEIENDAGELVGIPADMRGSGGGLGGNVLYQEGGTPPWLTGASGGAGGSGGGSLVTVSRGFGYGVSGEVDVSGADGSAGGTYDSTYGAGSGGGGAPGCLLHLLDGSAVTFPILVGNIVAEYGTSPITNSEARTQGKARAADPIDLGIANGRVAFVPASREPYPEYENVDIGPQDGADGADGAPGADGSDGSDGSDGLSIVVASVFRRSASVPSTPTADTGSYNFGTSTLTPPSGWSVAPPAADGNTLYVSQGTFDIQGTSGIDSTVTWSAPAVFVLDAGFRDIKFRRDAATPSTPTGDNPSGWYDEVPAGTAALWQVTGTKNSTGSLIGSWSTPERIGGIVWRNAYSPTTAYILHDAVAYQERTYICVQAGTGNAPSGTNSGNAYWDLMAGKGDPGDQATYNETIPITGSGPVNLRSLADAYSTPYDGVSDATVVYTLASGVTITGNAGGGIGIDTGSWPVGATISLTLQITGTVRGGGGTGGTGGQGVNGGNGQPGGAGGDAIYCQAPISITVNSGGVVTRGGGGGGGGGGVYDPSSEPVPYGGGGGGGGYPNGPGGAGGSGGTGGTAGSAGTTGGGGSGGAGEPTEGGDGGNGGGSSTSAQAGDSPTGYFRDGVGGALGAAGYAIRKNGNTVPVTNNGTITGTQG